MKYTQLFKTCFIVCLLSLAAANGPIDGLTATQSLKLSGAATDISFGSSIASGGDVNGDGFEDIIIGVAKSNTVYVIYGDTKENLVPRFSSFPIEAILIASSGFKVTGVANSNFGISVSFVGDLNNDGFDDIIVGASAEGSNRGAAYALYGGSTETLRTRFGTPFAVSASMPSTIGFKLVGAATSSYFGFSVASAGDVNKDGINDIIIGAYNEASRGAAYVIYGGASLGASYTVTTSMPSTTGFRVYGASNSNFGYSVASAGDINDDGHADIIIGAYGETSRTGAVYVLYGGSQSTLATNLGANFVVSASMASSTGFKLNGPAASSNFGISVASAGDINDDGFEDFLVGASTEGSSKGAVYVFFGDSSFILASKFGPSYTVSTNMAHYVGLRVESPIAAQLGSSVASAGDFNNDGFKDILIGGFNEESRTGSAYLLYGASATHLQLRFGSSFVLSDSMPPSVGFKLTGPAQDSFFGRCVASGDFNGDGTADIFVAATNDTHPAGAVYVVLDYNCPTINADGVCIEECPTATYNDTGICQDCYPGCNLCTSSDPHHCLACGTGALVNGTCLPSCPVSFFDSHHTCVGCPTGCTKCTSVGCQQCAPGLLLHNKVCVASCPCGFFDNNGVCTACYPGCCSCTSKASDSCTKCSVGSLFDGSCVVPCPQNFFNDKGTCKPCFAGCSSCTSEASDSCTACSSGVLLGGSCVASCPKFYSNVDDVCLVV